MHPPKVYVLYFQQLLPLSECEAKDGRTVGHLLMDLVEGKPDDLAHATRTFANCMAMLRDCGFPMGEFLVALILFITARGQSPPENIAAESPSQSVLRNATSVTKEQAAAIGRKLASAMCQPLAATVAAVHKIADLHSALRTMISRFLWFLPMLEVLQVRTAQRRRSTVARRLSSIVTPARGPEAIEATAEGSLIHVAPNAKGANDNSFDSVVRLGLHPPIARGVL
jgi:hypothetical protein